VVKTSASRVVLQRREYEPYGKQLTPALESGPGFTGHDTDPDTWNTYMQQRYYDPRVARFWSVDPVTVSSVGGNFNRYWYGNDNPYRFTDPDGRFAKGSGWTAESWKKFDQAQQAAANDLTKQADIITQALASGGQALANAQVDFETSFGAGSGTVENMSTMAGNLTKMAAALATHNKSSGFVANAKTATEMSSYKDFSRDVAMGVQSGSSIVLVNSDHFTFGNVPAMSRSIAHESAHAALGFPDQMVDGAKAISSGPPAQRAAFIQLPLIDPGRAMRNPDTIMGYGQ
jgi:RHS repeat-associated protein